MSPRACTHLVTVVPSTRVPCWLGNSKLVAYPSSPSIYSIAEQSSAPCPAPYSTACRTAVRRRLTTHLIEPSTGSPALTSTRAASSPLPLKRSRLLCSLLTPFDPRARRANTPSHPCPFHLRASNSPCTLLHSSINRARSFLSTSETPPEPPRASSCTTDEFLRPC